jgi:MFS family permease
VLAVTAVASLMVALDALVVSTALSTIRVHLHASVQQLEWTVNAYTLTFAVLLMTGSALGDRLGRRRMFCVGVGLFAAASAGCALSPDAGLLIAARAVQGAGAALVMPLALALVTAAFAPQDRPKALGIFGGVTGLAVSLGPLFGGAVVQGISWPSIFWLNVPVGLALIALAMGRIEESFGPRVDVDVRGLVLVTGAALGIIWALVRGNPAGWGSVEVIATLGLGALLAVAFVAWELRAGAPMLPMRLFGSRRFSAGNAATFLHWGSAFGALYLMAQFLQNGVGYGPLDAGLRLMPWGAVTVIVPLRRAAVHRHRDDAQRCGAGDDRADRRPASPVLADRRAAGDLGRRGRDVAACGAERGSDLGRAARHRRRVGHVHDDATARCGVRRRDPRRGLRGRRQLRLATCVHRRLRARARRLRGARRPRHPRRPLAPWTADRPGGRSQHGLGRADGGGGLGDRLSRRHAHILRRWGM